MMELKKEELEQLKTLLPDIESQFPTVEEVGNEARLSVPTSQVYLDHTLIQLLKNHEERTKDKQTVIAANITTNGKFRTRYELPEKKVKEDIKAATETALKQRENDIEQAKAKALDDLISDRLTALQEQQQAKALAEQAELKEKLLKQLFS